MVLVMKMKKKMNRMCLNFWLVLCAMFLRHVALVGNAGCSRELNSDLLGLSLSLHLSCSV